MLAGAAVLFAMVMVLLAFAFLRPGSGTRVAPSRWLVGGGLVLPTVTLAPLLVYGLFTGERLLPHAERSDAMRVDVIAEQWRWVIQYPEAEGGLRQSINVMHIPADRPIDVHITSTDVIHSFWVPRLAGKMDAIPGHVNVLRLVAAQAGAYHGVCAEFCGTGHTTMHMLVEAHAPEDYARALAEITEPAAEAAQTGETSE